MKFLFASDSFKGTLSSETIIGLLTQSAKEIFPGCETAGTLIADGGDEKEAVTALVGAGERQLRRVTNRPRAARQRGVVFFYWAGVFCRKRGEAPGEWPGQGPGPTRMASPSAGVHPHFEKEADHDQGRAEGEGQ